MLARDLKSPAYGTEIASEVGERVRVFYQDHGFFKAMVEAPQIKQAGASAVDVTVTVNAGQQYRLKDIQVTGSKAFSASELRSLFPMQTGDIFSSVAVRKGLEAIRRLYAQRGFPNFRETPAVTLVDSSREATLTLTVEEGTASSSSKPSGSTPTAADQDLPGFLKVSNGVIAPHTIYSPDPQYDAASKDAKAQGTAVYRVGVGSDGQVKALRFVSGRSVSGGELFPGLIKDGMKILRKWRFEPGRKDGQPVPVQIYVEITFRLY
jgi:hypothetical protein